jgi:hypothetical protein
MTHKTIPLFNVSTLGYVVCRIFLTSTMMLHTKQSGCHMIIVSFRSLKSHHDVHSIPPHTLLLWPGLSEEIPGTNYPLLGVPYKRLFSRSDRLAVRWPI